MLLSADSVNNNVWNPPKTASLTGQVEFVHCCLPMALVSILQLMMLGYL